MNDVNKAIDEATEAGKAVVEVMPRETATEVHTREVDVHQQMAQIIRTQQEQIRALQGHQKLFDSFRVQMNERLKEIVDGKMLVLDPVLSQRLQTMSERLQNPTYQIQIRSRDGRLRPANLLSVGSFAGVVQLVIDEGYNSGGDTDIFPKRGEVPGADD